jgi:hypothetical protein
MNLLEETVKVLADNGKSLSDIVAVQGNDFGIPIDEFIRLASETNYYSGYGTQEVAYDLVIIGKDWWLERAEYDGAEWWKFKQPPQIKSNIKSVSRLASGYCCSLGRLN